MLAPYLAQRTSELDTRLHWYCEPPSWAVDSAGCLRIEPAAATDFWQRTHYGFSVDNGHVLAAEMAGDFVLTVHTSFWPVHQYDQAGLMVRVSPSCWLKTSVEHEPDGPGRLGAVVTNLGYSDWSTQPFPAGAGSVWLRVRREGDDYLVEASEDGRLWQQLRVAHLHEGCGMAVQCGVYACSPKGAGFRAEFRHLTIETGRLE